MRPKSIAAVLQNARIAMYVKKLIWRKQSRWQRRFALLGRLLLACALAAACTLTVMWNSLFVQVSDDISCFHMPGNVLRELAANEPVPGSSVFFHETSCRKSCSDVHLNARQACSVESALIAHPEKDVFLLVSSPVLVPLVRTKNVLIRKLLRYPNFRVRHISFYKYLEDTPMSGIERSEEFNGSLWPVSHASDILRYATLYKFPGIYLDLDVLVIKSLAGLVNFAGAESEFSIGSGILGFGPDAVGREVATECAEELGRTFDGQIWGFNGPGVITRVLRRRCRTDEVREMSKKQCDGFDVHPVASFAAVSFHEVAVLFEEDAAGKVAQRLNASYAVHFWNKISGSYLVGNQTDVPFLHYASNFCPRIFAAVGGRF